MSVSDVSRCLSQPAKHYRGTRMQQGRVPLDSDWNEDAFLEEEIERRTERDVIGPRGTSNEGFRIGPNVGPAPAAFVDPGGNPIPTYDFDIEAGSFFIGGARFELEVKERFLAQNDWLQEDGIDRGALPTMPAAAQVPRHDLVYLRGWEQCVSATEDAEILERALGGPDTSTRTRLSRRVEVLTVQGDTCAEAFDELISRLIAPINPPDTSGTPHVFDRVDSCVRSKARLRVTFDNSGVTDDPCRPSVQGGFLGAENDTFRVALADSNTLVWGRDDSSPLYRVQLEKDGAGQFTVVRFLTAPRDQAAQPLLGQTVEILPWGALLPNGEKVSRLTGHFSRVSSSYDPEQRTITLDAKVPDEWDTWLQNHLGLHTPQDDPQQYFYLRLWTGGGVAPDGKNTLVAGTPFALTGTGLFVTLSDFGLPGEFWIIAARPHTPQIVVPWELMAAPGAESVGTRFWIAPLALIHWSVDAGNVVATVEDCRARFDPLTELGCCCTLTVGDQSQSHGDFASINDALAHLPPSGGEICVRPGVYDEHVLIQDKEHVTLKGCGRRSRIAPTDGSDVPVIEIVSSNDIRVEGFAIEAGAKGPGVRVTRTGPPSEGIALARMEVESGPATGIEIERAIVATITDCDVRQREGDDHAVYVEGEGIRVERNRIEAVPDDDEVTARGGLQIGGDTKNVLVSHNRIRYGYGNGITLGAIVVEAAAEPPGGGAPEPADPCAPCAPGTSFDPPVEGGPKKHPAAPLENIRIEDNAIRDMGLNGIGVDKFFDLREIPEMIFVDGLRILRNFIRQCLNRPIDDIPDFMLTSMGYGGIALADVRLLVVHDNVIERNGLDRRYPVCGVYVLHGEGVDLHRNRIMDNGRSDGKALDGPRPGARGGIWIQSAIAPTVPIVVTIPDPDGVRTEIRPAQDGTPAVRVHANIVSAPLGRALTAFALGPITVVANQLMTRAAAREGPASFALVATVLLFDLGVSNELYEQEQRYDGPVTTTLDGGDLPHVVDANLVVPGRVLEATHDILADGNVLFSDNQVLLSQLEPGEGRALFSIAIFSLDDVAFEDNQCECALTRGDDFVIVHALLFGLAARLNGNRLKEGVDSCFISAWTIGQMQVMATNNQSTHCFITTGPQRDVALNRHLVDLLPGLPRCDEKPWAVRSMYEKPPVYVARREPDVIG